MSINLLRKIGAAALAVTIWGCAAGAQAAPVKYDFDKAHTQVTFNVSHLGFSFSHGRFNEIAGHLLFDAENPAASSTEVTIKAASVDMGLDRWDAHIKNADFLDVEKHPNITFKSTGIEVTGENTANITGDLTILGVTRPAVLATTLNKRDTHPMSGKDYIGFSATTTIQRSAYGINYGLPNVGDDVVINIQVEGPRAEAAAP